MSPGAFRVVVRTLILGSLAAIPTVPTVLAAQFGVTYIDTSCPSVLNDDFNDYQPVKNFSDLRYDFWSVWFSVQVAKPLPSRNLYRAYPSGDIADATSTVVWKDARIQVHCFWERTPMYDTLHYDQVGSSGSLVKQCTDPAFPGGSGAGSTDWVGSSDISSTSYDPYDNGGADAASCEDPLEGGSAGGMGGAGCHTEYIYVDISTDGGVTWTTVWQGEVEVCG